MQLYNVGVKVIVRLQGANSPQEAEKMAWALVERLVKPEPLAHVSHALVSSIERK